MTSPLMTVLNTRPVQQADSLTQAFVAKNIAVLSCPAIDVHTLPISSELSSRLNSQPADKIIVTSRNAVIGMMASSFYPSFQRLFESQAAWYAIGKATSDYARQQHWPMQPLLQAGFDSESLLALPAMQSIQGETIWLLKGQGGRTLLKEVLTKRGATVIECPLYQRRSAPFCAENWSAFQQAAYPVLLITSLESAQAMLDGIAQTSDTELPVTALAFVKMTIVFSERIRQALEAWRWPTLMKVVQQQSDAGIIEAIQSIEVNESN